MEKLCVHRRNRVAKKKFLQSKWTVVAPQNKEKHFLAKGQIQKSGGTIITCVLEAVLTKQIVEVDLEELNNSDRRNWKDPKLLRPRKKMVLPANNDSTAGDFSNRCGTFRN